MGNIFTYLFWHFIFNIFYVVPPISCNVKNPQMRKYKVFCCCFLLNAFQLFLCCLNHPCFVICFQAIWENQFYYLFGFLFLVFVILASCVSQISIVMIYFQLCAEVCFVIILWNLHWAFCQILFCPMCLLTLRACRLMLCDLLSMRAIFIVKSHFKSRFLEPLFELQQKFKSHSNPI